MKERKFNLRVLLATAVVLLIAVIALVVSCSRYSEPVYNGERISRIIELRNPQESAVAALELGSDHSLPYLIHATGARETSWNQAKRQTWALLPSLWRSRYIKHMPMPADSTRIKALMVFSEIGTDAGEAVPALLQLLTVETNSAARELELCALADIGPGSPEVVTRVLEAARNKTVLNQDTPFLLLGSMGPRASYAVPALAQMLKTRDSSSRFVAYALGRIGPASSNALPAILEILNREEDPNLLRTLAKMGPAAAPAMPALAKAIEKRSLFFESAVESFFNIGPPAQQYLPLISSLLNDTNDIARIIAAAAVIRISGTTNIGLAVIVAEMERAYRGRSFWSPYNDMRGLNINVSPPGTAAWFAGELGPTAKAAVPALQKMLAGRQSWNALIAARSLWKIEGQSDRVLPFIIKALQSPEPLASALAARVLGDLGPTAQSALPELEKVRVRGPKEARHCAAWAVTQIKGPPD